MRSPFLITGLPRSRTAWFSLACTTPVSICHHEPTRTTRSFDDLKNLWAASPRTYVGMSDHGLGFQLARILAEIEPRTLIVERDVVAVWRSLGNYLPDDMQMSARAADSFLADLQASLDKSKSHPLVKRVPFESLNDYSVMIDCLEWLMPGGDFERVSSLMDMSVQVRVEATKRHLNEPHTLWFRP